MSTESKAQHSISPVTQRSTLATLGVIAPLLLATACTAAKGAPTFNPGEPSCYVELDQWGTRLSVKVQDDWAHVHDGLATQTRVSRDGPAIYYHMLGTRQIATTNGRTMTYNFGWGFKRSVDVTRDQMVMKAGLAKRRYKASGYCRPEDRAIGVAALEQVIQQREEDRRRSST